MRHNVGQVIAASSPLISTLNAPTPRASALSVQSPTGQGSTPLRSEPTLAAPAVADLPDGSSVIPTSRSVNYFTFVSTPTGKRGWIANTAIGMAGAPTEPPVGAPSAGPPAGTPTGAGVPVPSTVPQGPPVQVTAPASSSIPWAPLAIAAALGWFFLVEQKKKGKR